MKENFNAGGEHYKPRHEVLKDNHEHKAEQPKATHETHRHTAEKAEAAREIIEQHAEKAETTEVDVIKKEQRPAVHHHYLTKHIKNDKFVQTMSQVRTQLTPRERKFSTFIHTPKVEAVSEVGAKTVARPSGLLGGALLSLAGSLFVILIAKRIGFEVPQSIFAVLFLVGFGLGLLIEATSKLRRRNKESTL